MNRSFAALKGIVIYQKDTHSPEQRCKTHCCAGISMFGVHMKGESRNVNLKKVHHALWPVNLEAGNQKSIVKESGKYHIIIGLS